MKATAYVLCLSVLLTACNANFSSAHSAQPVTSKMPDENASNVSEQQFSATGTVRFQQLEGGFWGIVGDDGTRYDPMDLPPKFQKDGLRVRFDAVPETDMMSTRMWGTMITLIHIEALKPD